MRMSYVACPVGGTSVCSGVLEFRYIDQFARESPSTRLLFCVYLCTHVETRGQPGPPALPVSHLNLSLGPEDH